MLYRSKASIFYYHYHDFNQLYDADSVDLSYYKKSYTTKNAVLDVSRQVKGKNFYWVSIAEGVVPLWRAIEDTPNFTLVVNYSKIWRSIV